jgi:hypothetical protein
MRNATLIWVMSSTVAAFAGERMDVTVCNVGHIPDTAIEHAEIQAAYEFRAADVENHWTSRGVELPNPRIARPDRRGVHKVSVSNHGQRSVLGSRDNARTGHVLIGPGHWPNRIMRVAWSRKEVVVLSCGLLKLNDAEQATRPAGARPQRLGIHLYDLANISPQTLDEAAREAARVLATAGVEVVWQRGPADSAEAHASDQTEQSPLSRLDTSYYRYPASPKQYLCSQPS